MVILEEKRRLIWKKKKKKIARTNEMQIVERFQYEIKRRMYLSKETLVNYSWSENIQQWILIYGHGGGDDL